MTDIKAKAVSTSPCRSVSWIYDVGNGRLACSDEARGFKDADANYLHFFEQWSESYLPGYCTLISESFAAFLQNQQPFESEIPLGGADGTLRKVQISGQVIADAEGKTTTLKGSIHGIPAYIGDVRTDAAFSSD